MNLAAVSTSAVTAYVDEMVVTPSACTLEPLADAEISEIVGAATPVSIDLYQETVAARSERLREYLRIEIVDGMAVITAGGAVPERTAEELHLRQSRPCWHVGMPAKI